MDDSESDSNDEFYDQHFVDVPELQVRKRREIVLEEAVIDSYFSKESDTEGQPKKKKRVVKKPGSKIRRFRISREVEKSTNIGASIEEARDDKYSASKITIS